MPQKFQKELETFCSSSAIWNSILLDLSWSHTITHLIYVDAKRLNLMQCDFMKPPFIISRSRWMTLFCFGNWRCELGEWEYTENLERQQRKDGFPVEWSWEGKGTCWILTKSVGEVSKLKACWHWCLEPKSK